MFTPNHEGSRKPVFTTPPNKLKIKVGHGGIDESLLNKADEIIKSSEIDFSPIATSLLNSLESFIDKAKQAKTEEDLKIANDSLANAIMQLKANGGMFKYQLISEIAALALHFLDHIESLNHDAISVIDVHAKALNSIVRNKLSGDGGKHGYALVKELEQACTRYFKKYQPKT
jgi:hypothetical protein